MISELKLFTVEKYYRVGVWRGTLASQRARWGTPELSEIQLLTPRTGVRSRPRLPQQSPRNAMPYSSCLRFCVSVEGPGTAKHAQKEEEREGERETYRRRN